MGECAEKQDIARLDGRIDGLVDRVARVEDWLPESRQLHQEARGKLTAMEAVERERDRVATERHAENVEHMNAIEMNTGRKNNWIAVGGVIIAILMLVETAFLGYLTYKSNNRPTTELFRTQTHQPRYNASITLPQDAAGGEYVPQP